MVVADRGGEYEKRGDEACALFGHHSWCDDLISQGRLNSSSSILPVRGGEGSIGLK